MSRTHLQNHYISPSQRLAAQEEFVQSGWPLLAWDLKGWLGPRHQWTMNPIILRCSIADLPSDRLFLWRILEADPSIASGCGEECSQSFNWIMFRSCGFLDLIAWWKGNAPDQPHHTCSLWSRHFHGISLVHIDSHRIVLLNLSANHDAMARHCTKGGSRTSPPRPRQPCQDSEYTVVRPDAKRL